MQRDYLFIDAYNIIFCWDNLKKIAEHSLEDARKKFLDILSDFQGSSGYKIIVVFDAHNVAGGIGRVEPYSNLTVIFTKEDETADNYIERCASILARHYKVRVATNDSLQQLLIVSKGAVRITARELYNEVTALKKIRDAEYIGKRPVKRNQLFDNLNDELKEAFTRMIHQREEE